MLRVAIGLALLTQLITGAACRTTQADHRSEAVGQPVPATMPTEDAHSGMVYIPGGTFTMGSEEGSEKEKPLTQVTLSPYHLDRTEVSVAAYKACVEAEKCTAPNSTDFCNWGQTGKENHPINCVDWNQAQTYCAAQGGRLPTEAEWEFAARGTDGRKYPWGNSEPDENRACFHPTCGTGTAPVDSHASGASPFGLLNMAGNVFEWVADAYGAYPGGRVTNPRQETGSTRVVRGGGWDNYSSRLRASDRYGVGPASRYYNLGFRCARGAGR